MARDAPAAVVMNCRVSILNRLRRDLEFGISPKQSLHELGARRKHVDQTTTDSIYRVDE